ncbi:MAG: ATP-dependent DNA ligase [Sandaracinaceae bacterium]|nr:ATP-dependent DNA ligase [Sandaracinaceae bacterium]
MKWAESFEPYAGGQRAPIESLADEALAKALRNYKRAVAKRYRVVDPDQIERLLPPGTYWVSNKLDGELWFLVKREGEVALCAYNGRVVRGTPLAKEAERVLSAHGDIVVAGELIAPPSPDARARVQHVATAFGDEALEKAMQFHAFDLVDDGGTDMQLKDYAERLEKLRAVFPEQGRVRLVHTEEADPQSILRLYREWVVSDRYEGIVVRSDRGLTYKIKSTLTIDAVVLAYGERITGSVHQVREMSVGLLRDDGTWQLVGAVGNGFSEQDRAAWHARLSTMEVPSSFRLANREGTLSKFVRPEIVVEIRVSDLLASDGWDAPIRRMSLSYSPEAGYKPLGETPTAVMIHPIFQRERTDKTVDAGNVGMTQITSHVPLETPEAGGARAILAPAEIVRRAVFTKDNKGAIAVRKYAIIDTHKGEDRNYPPFVVYFTDYSPGRKEPLQTAMRTASTMERAGEQVELWLADNVKRGWAEVEDKRIGEPVGLPEEAAKVIEAAKAKAEAPPKKKAAAKKKDGGEGAEAASGESAPKKKAASTKKASKKSSEAEGDA